jgi:hypothetical protein
MNSSQISLSPELRLEFEEVTLMVWLLFALLVYGIIFVAGRAHSRHLDRLESKWRLPHDSHQKYDLGEELRLDGMQERTRYGDVRTSIGLDGLPSNSMRAGDFVARVRLDQAEPNRNNEQQSPDGRNVDGKQVVRLRPNLRRELPGKTKRSRFGKAKQGQQSNVR